MEALQRFALDLDSKKFDDEITLSINGLGHSGEGVGHLDGITIFVDGALPGEIIKARLFCVKKTHAFAKLISVTTPSPHRVKPPCPIFDKCGGCQIMHLSYIEQLKFKKKRVADALERIGKIDPTIVLDPIPSPLEFGYRNKIQLPVRDLGGPTLGLYAKNSHDLVPVDRCLIHCDLGEEVFKKLKDLVKASKLEPYDQERGKGELRHVLIKSAVHTNEALVVFVTNRRPSTALKTLSHDVFNTIPAVKGVVHNLHKQKENVILGDTYQKLEGSSYIQETLLNLTFFISPASFFQVNPLQAENLYLKALELADVHPDMTVLDMYCGVGTLSLIFAKKAKKVIGVESVSAAIKDAKKNAIHNKIDNVSFVCAPAETFIHTLDSIDVLLLNPPRKGCDPSFLEGVKKLAPKKIIYISCDPATLARDLRLLDTYKPVHIQPFDMFPQTAHVECVVELLPK